MINTLQRRAVERVACLCLPNERHSKRVNNSVRWNACANRHTHHERKRSRRIEKCKHMVFGVQCTHYKSPERNGRDDDWRSPINRMMSNSIINCLMWFPTRFLLPPNNRTSIYQPILLLKQPTAINMRRRLRHIVGIVQLNLPNETILIHFTAEAKWVNVRCCWFFFTLLLLLLNGRPTVSIASEITIRA